MCFAEQQCELLRDPVHGEVHQTGRYLGDRAIYTCSPGWEIVGAEERVCQADGAWTNQEPFCKKRGRKSSIPWVNWQIWARARYGYRGHKK